MFIYTHTHTHTWLRTDCIWIAVATKQHCSETFEYQSERCEVLTGYLSLGRRSGGDWTNPWHWTERFTVFFWNSKQQQPQLLPRVVLVAFLKEAFITNIVITLRINYIIMFINNNAVFNNNQYKTPRFYFALQNSHVHAEGFFRNLQTIWTLAASKSPVPSMTQLVRRFQC